MRGRNKKAQIILIFIGLILIISTYFYYPNQNKENLSRDTQKQLDLNETDSAGENTFENVEYKGFYDLESPFVVKSESATMLTEEPDLVFMKNMHVTLYLKDGRVVEITSNEGKYNKVTYDCFFEQNVKATDGETNIFADNLDLLATKNNVQIYNNVNLIYPTGSLLADKIDYDFETKFFKVSMFDDNSIKMKVTQ
tara:strand:+ start:1659 stop:2246 length:588 start_codon:yes stop_codon:yes gene_type:complete